MALAKEGTEMYTYIWFGCSDFWEKKTLLDIERGVDLSPKKYNGNVDVFFTRNMIRPSQEQKEKITFQNIASINSKWKKGHFTYFICVFYFILIFLICYVFLWVLVKSPQSCRENGYCMHHSSPWITSDLFHQWFSNAKYC